MTVHSAPQPTIVPGLGAIIGWVGDRPVPRDRLDRRISGLRNGPLRGALPAPGSSEDRQLARWLTQVILTESLCEAVAADLGLPPGEGAPHAPETPPDQQTPGIPLDRVAAVELGSINAAAYQGSPWVRAVFRHVTAAVSVPPEWRRPSARQHTPRHLVRHRLFTDHSRARAATPSDLEPLGAITLDSLPAAIAEAIQRHPYGTLVGPAEDALGWHVALATPVSAPPDPQRHPTTGASDHDSPLLEAARRRAFARWLDDMRAKQVRLVPGLEHPGDPRQPDNHHKH